LLSVRVQPRASRDEIVGWQGDTLRVRVSAPPVEGEANMAIRRLVARALGVAPGSVELVRGDRSRDKVIRVAGLALADIRMRLAGVVAGVLLLAAVTPAVAEHLTLAPEARVVAPSLPRPFDADISVRTDDHGFHIGGRMTWLGQVLSGWLRGRTSEGNVVVDGQWQSDRAWNFRLDADPQRPSFRIEIYPGTM
jgi:hypothetical protein